MTDFAELWPGGPAFAQAPHAKLGTDSILLADFVQPERARRGVDLGCASGILCLLLLARAPKLTMTGLELQPEAAELARENLARNGWADRGEVIHGDIRAHRTLFAAGSFDLVVANPPYFPLNHGALPPDPDRATARGELCCSLEELCAAAAWLCRSGGSVCLVHKPERLADLFCTLRANGIEPKRLRLVCNSIRSAPSLVLVEGRRGGRPGLSVEPVLFLRDESGGESEEILRIYHKKQP